MGNQASLESLPDDPSGVRIAIGKAETGISHDVQLNHLGLKVQADQRYAVSFRGRSDRPRSIFVGIAQAHAPWTGLGLYKEMHLTPEWQSFEEQFEAIASDENGRIHFDVRGSDTSVELSSVSLGGLPAMQFLEFVCIRPRTGEPASHERSEIGRLQAPGVAAPNDVQFGALRRLTPISRDWGWDRGLPIDRCYIENFLSLHKEDIRGRVLEVGDNFYTRKFGGDRVTVSDVLHVVEGNPRATIVADLTRADHIPSETFDCVIFTQTLNRIYDSRAALKTLDRILKPDGVLLASFPGITRTDLSEPAGAWYWSFTSASARRLFEEVFSAASLLIKPYGNALTATSFLYGLAKEELSEEELDYFDPEYEVLITVRAVKTAL